MDSHSAPTNTSHGIVQFAHNTGDNNDKHLARFELQASYHHKAMQPTKLGLDNAVLRPSDLK